MSDSKRDTWKRARRQAAIDAMAFRERQPSKQELRADLANAVRNTAVRPLPPYAHGKTRSEHGGSSA